MTVYNLMDVVGTSGTSVSDAIRGALERAQNEAEKVQWFEVKEIRGRVNEGDQPEFQVKVEIGYLAPATSGAKGTRTASRRTGTSQSRSEAAQVAARKGQKGRSDLARGFQKQSKKK